MDELYDEYLIRGTDIIFSRMDKNEQKENDNDNNNESQYIKNNLFGQNQKVNFKTKVYAQIKINHLAESGRKPILYKKDGKKDKDLLKKIVSNKIRLKEAELVLNERDTPGRYGNAGNRTKSQKEKLKIRNNIFKTNLPRDTIIAYTDGACADNPGPSRAGEILRSRR